MREFTTEQIEQELRARRVAAWRDASAARYRVNQDLSRLVRAQPAFIGLLAPLHSGACTDAYRSGLVRDGLPSRTGHLCPRCCLLDMRDGVLPEAQYWFGVTAAVGVPRDL